MTEHIEVDYLIVGAGAMGMAFADTLLAETDKTMVIVDRHAKPGGHWNDAYPFVTLHQPSAYYGVSSRELSTGRIDQTGLNKGLNDLATLPQLMAYFEAVMGEQFLPSGRVRYLPLCNHLGGGVVEAVLGKARYQITVREKIVDATWLKTTVPSTHEPNFDVASGVNFMPLNELPKLAEAPSDYVVIGGGKTGIDAIIWLLEYGVDPATIRWIMPRDAWLFTRETTQPGAAYFEATIGAQANLMQAVAEAETVPGLFLRLEQAGIFTRIDPSITPKMMHGATISQPELEALRSVKHVLRKGRVVRIGPNHFELEQGREPCGPDTLFIDCSARAVGNMQVRPVFEDDTIYLQTVRTVQPVF
ncbi:MAG: NAD(P)-binding protein, partial [Pseudomonadota bacterium]